MKGEMDKLGEECAVTQSLSNDICDRVSVLKSESTSIRNSKTEIARKKAILTLFIQKFIPSEAV